MIDYEMKHSDRKIKREQTVTHNNGGFIVDPMRIASKILEYEKKVRDNTGPVRTLVKDGIPQK